MVHKYPYDNRISDYHFVDPLWMDPQPESLSKVHPSRRQCTETAAFDLLMALFAFAIAVVLLVTAPANPGCIIPLLVVYYAAAGLHLLRKACHLRDHRS
jgi:hypothetical protein